uniref:Uncharacterized protein n=1 Tax=Triticum urartu TaxID=4572 RepID=A0A8R7PD26_TRIUA
MQWLTIGELEDRAVWRVRTTLQHWSTCHRCCVLMQRRSCSWYRMVQAKGLRSLHHNLH